VPRPVVTELVGVYDADGTVLGEIRYWLGARLGRAHCALCDVSHGTFRRRPEWSAYLDTLPVPLHTFHRDDRPTDLDGLGPAPLVAARTAAGARLLLGPDDLEACAASVPAFAAALTGAVATSGLSWPVG